MTGSQQTSACAIKLPGVVNFLLAKPADGVGCSRLGVLKAVALKLDGFAAGPCRFFMAWHWGEGSTQTWADSGRAAHCSLSWGCRMNAAGFGAVPKHCTQLGSFLRTAALDNQCTGSSCLCSQACRQATHGAVHLCSTELEAVSQNVFGCYSETKSPSRAFNSGLLTLQFTAIQCLLFQKNQRSFTAIPNSCFLSRRYPQKT